MIMSLLGVIVKLITEISTKSRKIQSSEFKYALKL